MPVRIVRLGSPRHPREGLRLGTVRRPPRGVPKAQHAARDFYDVWLPNLAPSEALLKSAKTVDDARSWAAFERVFLAEMKSARCKQGARFDRGALAHDEPVGRLLLRRRGAMPPVGSSPAARRSRRRYRVAVSIFSVRHGPGGRPRRVAATADRDMSRAHIAAAIPHCRLGAPRTAREIAVLPPLARRPALT
jgi:uncharacterized protein YeaO (DUF488 family)